MQADKDLGSQQNQLASMKYDLRITNLARFLYSKMDNKMTHEKSHTLLDVGAGNGLFLKFFKSKGFTISGFELEKELVQNMKKDPALKGDKIEQGDITQMKGNEEFDVVIASDVIEHIKDDVKAIQGLWSYVKPGGMLLITVPAHSYLYGKRDEMWGHFRRYDQQVLLERIDNAISLVTRSVKHGALSNNSESLQKDDLRNTLHDSRTIVFAKQWNLVGFFVYGFYEKILHKSINENMRYSNSLPSRMVRLILDAILKFEEMVGGVPIGLTQVVGVKKRWLK